MTRVCSLEHSDVTKDTGMARIGEILSAKLSVSCFPEKAIGRAFEDAVFPHNAVRRVGQ